MTLYLAKIEVWLLYTALPVIVLYHCMKFDQIPFKKIKLFSVQEKSKKGQWK